MAVDCLVVGGGQAGLAMAYQLQRAGLSYRILEASAQQGGSWPDYYDSLTLFSPARYSALPGLAFPGDPDAYPRRDDVVAYLRGYARSFDLAVELNQRVTRVTRQGDLFIAETATGTTIAARSVVAASGAFSQPYMPEVPGLGRFSGRVLHSKDYRSPGELAGRRVVVIGGANSAVQIAHELTSASRVTLASRRAIRFVPQRILGRDFHFWIRASGLDFTPWLSDQSTPVLDDGRYRRALKNGVLQRRPVFDQVTEEGVVWADGRRERIDALVFATGFRPSVPYLAELQSLDAQGQLQQCKGIAKHTPGLYFMGYPRQRNFASATLRGVGADAAHVLRHLRSKLPAL